MMTKQTLPCPFCGATGVAINKYGTIDKYYVHHSCKGSDLNIYSGYHDTRKQAIEVWNKRVCACRK